MSNLCVYTTGTNLDLLKESCETVMITLETYPCDPWKGYVTGKLREGIKFLETRTEPYAMWVDGNDSLILQPEAEILARLNAFGGPMIISAERTCWPQIEMEAGYKTQRRGMMPPIGVPLFINSGGYIGRREILVTSMHIALAAAMGSEDDQLSWTKAYVSGLLPDVQIDHSRYIFSSVGDGDDALKANACAMHWNGRSPGREEYWSTRNAYRSKTVVVP